MINKYIDKQNIDEIIEKNTAKYNEKLKKRGQFTENLNKKAATNTRFVNPYKPQKTEEEKAALLKSSTEYYKRANKDAKPGSIASATGREKSIRPMP